MEKEIQQLIKAHKMFCEVANNDDVYFPHKPNRKIQNAAMIMSDTINSLIDKYNKTVSSEEQLIKYI